MEQLSVGSGLSFRQRSALPRQWFALGVHEPPGRFDGQLIDASYDAARRFLDVDTLPGEHHARSQVSADRSRMDHEDRYTTVGEVVC